MGASQSNKNTDHQNTNYQKIIRIYNLQKDVSHDDFLQILAHCDKSLVNSIWKYTVGSEFRCSESQFDTIVDQCRFRTGQKWTTYLLEISGLSSIANSDQMRIIINWMSFSCDALYPILSKSYPALNTNDIDISDFLTWIDRNIPDIGIDLSRCIHRTLTGSPMSFQDFHSEIVSIINLLQSNLISPHVLILLCASLPICYKISDKIDEYIFTNASSWIMLYSSDVHGISASRLKEKAFDYDGNLLLLVKCDSGLFCLASDIGLKEDWNAYGGEDARFLQLEPFFKKHLTGTRPNTTKSRTGIIYSHFSAKSSRRGIFVGHNPLSNAFVEIDEDLMNISIFGHSEQIRLIEVFAVGSGVEQRITKLKDMRNWENREVIKHKNRKIKAEDWTDNPDREILDMGGVNVRHADLVGGIDRDLELHS